MASARTTAALLAALLGLAAAVPATGADTAQVQVSAAILSPSNCKFSAAATALAFGNVPGGSPSDAVATATVNVRCMGAPAVATFGITDDDGLNEAGPDANRMRRSAAPFNLLPYQLTYAPAAATIPKNVWTTITLTGRILRADLNAALPGTYNDTVTLSLLP